MVVILTYGVPDSGDKSLSPRMLMALYLTITFESFTRLKGEDLSTLIGIRHCLFVTTEL